MSYSEIQKARIEKLFSQKGKACEGRPFMGGYCFFLDDKMAVGLDIDKKSGKDRLMARIGEEAMHEALLKKGAKPMDITGRPMKGFIFVEPEGFARDSDLDYWLTLAVAYNPLAKRTKKKSK